jgi:hypothetical protein
VSRPPYVVVRVAYVELLPAEGLLSASPPATGAKTSRGCSPSGNFIA